VNSASRRGACRGRLVAEPAEQAFYDGVADEVVRVPTDAVDGVRREHVRAEFADALLDHALDLAGVHVLEAAVGEVQHGHRGEAEHVRHAVHFPLADGPHLLHR